MPLEISHNGTLTVNDKTFVINEQSLRSDAVTEIISHRPGFMLRWGITIFFFILLMILFICWLIQYPDLVMAKAKLTSTNAPKEIVCKTDGKLIKLNAKEGQEVRPGDLLGYMESTAWHKEVIDLSDKLDTSITFLATGQTDKAAILLNQHYEHLGELQTAYQQFSTARQQFNDYLINNFYNHKKQVLENDLSVLQQMNTTIKKQQELNEKDLAVAQESYEMNKKLMEEKVISKEEYRAGQSKLLSKQQSIPQLQSAALTNMNQQADKQKELDQLEHDIQQQRITFEQAVQTLKSNVDDWKKKYLFIAPIEGKISFATFLQENQQMKTGQQFCFINPESSKYYAEMYIPQANFGKVKTGATVLLKFPSYPFQEFGSVKGQIEFISHIPTDSGYLAKILLPSGLSTNYQKQVQYRDGLNADAEIITRPMRLLQRFYYNIVKIEKR